MLEYCTPAKPKAKLLTNLWSKKSVENCRNCSARYQLTKLFIWPSHVNIFKYFCSWKVSLSRRNRYPLIDPIACRSFWGFGFLMNKLCSEVSLVLSYWFEYFWFFSTFSKLVQNSTRTWLNFGELKLPLKII